MRSIDLALFIVLGATLLYSAETAPAPALPLRDCSSETGLADRSDIVFCEPWEDPNWFQKGYGSPRLLNPPAATKNDVRHTSIETNGCVSGKCLKLSMKQFVTTASSLHRALRNAGLQPEQLYMTRTLSWPTGVLALTLPRATVVTGRPQGMDVDGGASVTVAVGGSQHGDPGHVPGRWQHPADPGRSGPAAPRSAAVALADRGHPQAQPGRLTDAALGCPRDCLHLPRRSRAARPQRGKVVSVPVLAVVGVRADGQKVLVELDLCGGESYEAWKGA